MTLKTQKTVSYSNVNCRTSLKEDYFIADCCYQEEKFLESKSKVLLHVVEISKDKTLVHLNCIINLLKNQYVFNKQSVFKLE